MAEKGDKTTVTYISKILNVLNFTELPEDITDNQWLSMFENMQKIFLFSHNFDISEACSHVAYLEKDELTVIISDTYNEYEDQGKVL